MKLSIQVLQDDQDIESGMCQLTINEDNKTFYQYFTWKEWNAFKEAVNKLDFTENHVNYAPENNPLTELSMDNSSKYGSSICIIFGGIMSIDLYLEGKQGLIIWRSFKNEVNDFGFAIKGEA